VVKIGRATAEQLAARLEGKPFECFQELGFERAARASARPLSETGPLDGNTGSQ
jgi:hypothetical protein